MLCSDCMFCEAKNCLVSSRRVPVHLKQPAPAADGRATSGAVSVASAGVGADGELVVAPGVLANANLWPRRSQRSC